MTKLIRGANTGRKGDQGGGRTPTTEADSLDSKSYAKVLDLICEGEIEGLKDGLKSVYLNNTPIQNGDGSYNFSGVGHSFRVGDSDQTRIDGYDKAATTVSVNRRVIKDTPNIGETETVATSTSVNDVRVIVRFPALQEIEDDGDIVGTSVTIKIQRSVDGGGFTDQRTDTITGRTGDMYKRAYIIKMPTHFTSEVKIRIIRITDNAADNTRLANETWWDSFVQLSYTNNTYPNSALASLEIDAQQFPSIPRRAYLIRGAKIRIPSNATVDSDTGALIYSGTWNGTFQAATWCADPAWCLWDLLTSQRYGLGDHVLTLSEQTDPNWDGDAERLSKFDFYAASQYCSANNTRPNNANNDYGPSGRHGIADGFGGFEPRFSCNVYIQGRTEAFDLINAMSAVFMAMPYWAVGSLAISQDKPQSSSYLFTLANITSEGFTYSGSSQRSRATAVVVKYFDKTLRTFAYEEVLDDASMFNGISRYGVITKNIEAFACTSRGQAKRVGRWMIYSEARETEVVRFTLSLEAGVLVRPGQVIEVSDPLKAGVRRGGRIAAATAGQITVDGTAGVDTDLPQGLTAALGYTRTLHVLLANGTVESKTVSNIAGNVITLDNDYSAAPNVNSVWVLETTGGSSAQNLQTTQWRVVAVEEVDDLEYKVSALAYNSSKYANVESGFSLTQRDFSNLNEIPAPPSGLNIIEQLYKQADQVKSKLVISWEAVLGVSKYEVRWRKDNSDWHVYTKIGTNDEIPDVTAGSFEIRIYSLNATGVPSAVPLSNTTIATGKDRSPSTVTNFSYTLDPKLGFILHWDKLVATYPYFDDLDVVGYEIRTTDAEWGLENNDYYNFASPVAGENLIARVTANSYNLGFTPPGSRSYYIKAYDSQGTYSVNAGSQSIAIAAPLSPTSTAVIEGNFVVISWTKVQTLGRYAIDYYQVSKNLNFTTVLESLDTTVYKREVDWTGAQTFYVRSVDIAGNFSTANSVTLQNTQASNYGLSVNYDSGTSADLTWSERNGGTPTVAYQIAHSPTSVTSFGEATGNQQIQGTAFSFLVNWNTDRRFWIRSIDAQGNTGAEEYFDISFTIANAVSNLTSTFKGTTGNALLKSELELAWTAAVKGSLNIEEYEIRRGTTFALVADGGDAVLISTIKALVATTQVDWNGTQRFWVVAKDVNGNYGTETSIDATITPPAAVGSFAQEVIDNNVLLNWSAAESVLPILYYNIKRQTDPNLPLDTVANFNSRGKEIGTKQGLFTTVFETIAGTYTYWIAAIDSANNTGQPVSITSSVNQPPDYILRKDVNSIFESQPSVPTVVTKTNAFADQGFLFVNVDTTRTYKEHFDPNNNDTSRTFGVYGGSTLYGLPSATAGAFTEILDYGTTLAGTKVTMTFTGEHQAGSTTTAKISTSPTGPNDSPSGSYSWTDFPLAAPTSPIITHSAFGTAFRYIKFDFAFASAGNDDLLKVTSLNMRLDTKQITDSGNGTASASDSSGTVVNFNLTFVDIESITVTPKGTSSTGALIAIYDFTDVPNPTSFKVLLYNSSGTRVSGDFSWTARGN